jgi:hypothetical protein
MSDSIAILMSINEVLRVFAQVSLQIGTVRSSVLTAVEDSLARKFLLINSFDSYARFLPFMIHFHSVEIRYMIQDLDHKIIDVGAESTISIDINWMYFFEYPNLSPLATFST